MATHRTLNSLVGSLTLVLASRTSDAFADCPQPYSGDACNGGSGSDICTFTSTSVSCSFNDIAGTQGAEGYFHNTSNTTFRGFGTDSAGETFCCEYTGLVDACNDYTDPIVETFNGSNYVDTIKLQYSTYDLKCATATVYANGAGDDIHGSRTFAVNYLEFLYGGDGSDTIHGYAGLDEIYGGDSTDIIWGGDDADIIYGEDGNDQIKGDDGDDDLYGGAGNDEVCGGMDSDTIDGGVGSDLLFSGTGVFASQTVYGGGGTGTDTCGNLTYATLSSCTGGTSLAACPW